MNQKGIRFATIYCLAIASSTKSGSLADVLFVFMLVVERPLPKVSHDQASYYTCTLATI